MTRDKLEYFRQMMHSGMITKEEFKDIEMTYENQDRSFLEIDGKKEAISKVRSRVHEDDPYSAYVKSPRKELSETIKNLAGTGGKNIFSEAVKKKSGSSSKGLFAMVLDELEEALKDK